MSSIKRIKTAAEMGVEINLAFPLLIPRNSEFTAFDGFISAGKEDIQVSIELPADGDVRNARIRGHWKLQYLLQGNTNVIKQRLSQCSDLKAFLVELQNILEVNCKQTMTSNQFMHSYSVQLLKEIEDFGWTKLSYVNENLNVLKIREVDNFGREHEITIELPENYPNDSANFITDLPVKFALQWNSSCRLNDIQQQFCKYISSFQQFWDMMDELDGNAWILEPEKPSRKDTNRRLAINTSASIQIQVDPYNCFAIPECSFLGSDQSITPLRDRFNSNLDKWDFNCTLLINIQNVLEITFPSRELTKKEDFVVACAICYSYHLDDITPDKICDDNRCRQSFHSICLYEWLKVLPSSRLSFNVIFGDCPYCSKVSKAFIRLLRNTSWNAPAGSGNFLCLIHVVHTCIRQKLGGKVSEDKSGTDITWWECGDKLYAPLATWWNGVVSVIVFVALIVPPVVSTVEIAGYVDRNEVWKRDKSPFVAKKDVLITEDGNLVVEPGVVVYFHSGVGITVKGTIRAQGTAYNRIQFVRQKGKIFDKAEFNGQDMRLVGGSSILEGKLQVFHNQKWRSVCTSLNWTEADYNATCRSLGLTSGEFYQWFDHVESNEPSVEFISPGCEGNETSLKECKWDRRRLGKGVCDFYSFIGIRCHPRLNLNQPNQNHWRGISFQNAKTSEATDHELGKKKIVSDSVLEYVDILNAGNNKDGELSSALEIVGVAPRMMNITVRLSKYNGINISECTSAIQIKDSIISENKGHGVFVNTSVGSIRVENTEVTENDGHGIYYVYFNEGNFVGKSPDFCTSPDIGFAQQYPTHFLFEQAVNFHPLSCYREFQTENKKIFTIHFLKISSSVNDSGIVTIRDGQRETSPLLMQFKINNNTRPQSVASTGSFVRVDIEMLVQANCQVLIQVEVDLTKVSDLTVTKSTVEHNGGVGVYVENMRSFVQVGASIVKQNHYLSGILINGGSGDVNISESTISNNVGDGINIKLAKGRVNVTLAEISQNDENGLSVAMDETSGDNLYQSRTLVASSIVARNKKIGLKIGPQDFVNVTMNMLRHCPNIALKIESGSSDNDENFDRGKEVYITNNVFFFNDYVSVEIESLSATNIMVGHNQFRENQGECLVFDKQVNPTLKNSWTAIIVAENTFERNRGQFVALLDVPHAVNHSLLFTHNYLDDNSVKEHFPSLNSRSNVAAVIILASPSVDVYRNRLINTLSRYEIASRVVGPYVKLNCTHNAYGTTDVRKIYPRLFDCKHRYHLSCIKVKPYLRVASDLETAFIFDSSDIYMEQFYMPGLNEIGGHVSGRERLPEGTYIVKKDIYVKPQATLTIGSNVQVHFDPGIGMMVQGKVNIEGGRKESERVLFTSNAANVLLVTSVARLVSVSEDRTNFVHEGRLEISVKGKWGTVCNHGWTKEVAALVCHQMGLEFNHNDWQFKPRNLRTVYSEIVASNIRCHFLETNISKCEFDSEWDIENTCTHEDDVHVRCYEPTWAGLRFGLAADESVVEFTTIEKAGFHDYHTDLQYNALQVDFMHHNLWELVVRNNIHSGIAVVFHDYFYNLEKMKIWNSGVTSNFGHGIYTRTPGLRGFNLTIANNTMSGVHFDPFISRSMRRELSSWVATDQKIRQFVVSMAKSHPSVIDIKRGKSIFVITEQMANDGENRVRFRTNAGDVFGIQILNPISTNSTEILQIADADSSDTFWTSNEDTAKFPAIAPFSKLSIICNFGSRSFGGAVLYITALENNEQRISAAVNPELMIDKSAINGNFDGLKVIHYDNTIDFEDNWNPRVVNQSINIFETRLQYQTGAALDITTAFSNSNHDIVVNTSYIVESSFIMDNKLGIIEKADDLLNSKQIINWRILRTRLDLNDGTVLNITLPHVWNSTEPVHHDIFIKESVFAKNKNFAFILDGYFAKFTMLKNWFTENNSPNDLIVIGGVEKEMWLSRNAFRDNTVKRVITFDINSHTKLFNQVEANFKNNFVINNTGSSGSSGNNFRDYSYSMGVFGLQFINVTNNFLGPNNLDYDFVCGIKVNSLKNTMNARENWWGTRDVSAISNRILDFDDSSTYAAVEYIPFFKEAALNPEVLSHDKVPLTISYNNMGGRLYTSETLKNKGTPYTVTSDLIVMAHTTLTIEPGVEISFHSGVGILVLGSLVARGNDDEMIIFRPAMHRAKRFNQNNGTAKGQDVRLCFDGSCDEAEKGFLEVFNQTFSQWVPVCDSAFTEANAQVVCNQINDDSTTTQPFLKFGLRYDLDEKSINRIQSWTNPSICSGKEDSWNECPQRVGVDGQSCAVDSQFVFVYCIPSPTHDKYWGGITFAPPNYERKTFRGITDAADDIPTESLLDHVLISGAGNLRGEKCSAVQAIYKLPKMVNCEIMNGASHGVTIVAPMTAIDITRTQFTNNHGFGVNVLDFRSDSRENKFPLNLPLKPLHLPSELFGMADICNADKVIPIKDRILIYYKYRPHPSTCIKVFTGVQHLGFRLLHFNMFKNYGKDIDFVRVFDGDISSEDKEELKMLRGELKEGRVIIKSESSKLSVQVVANAASEVHGFVAEIFSVPPISITFDDYIHHEISDNTFERNYLGAIYYSSFGEVIPSLSISSNIFLQNGIEIAENFSTSDCVVALNLQNSNSIRFSSNLLKQNQGGLCISAESDSRLSSLPGSIVNNLFTENVNRPVLDIRSYHTSLYHVVVNNNAFTFNNVSYKPVLILDEVKLTATRNYIYNNTGFHILHSTFDGNQSTRNSYQLYRHNTFLNNTARNEKFSSTILIGSSGQTYFENVFTNPSNDFEIEAAVDSKKTGVVNATNNWWGYNHKMFVSARIHDKFDNEERVKVVYAPFLESERTLADVDCLPGWERIGGACHHYFGGKMDKWDAEYFCNNLNATVSYVKSSEINSFIYLLRHYQDQYDSKAPVRVRVIEFVPSGGCSALLYDGIESVSCSEKYSFFCAWGVDWDEIASERNWQLGIIIGGVVGAFVIVLIIILLCICRCAYTRRAKEKKRRQANAEKTVSKEELDYLTFARPKEGQVSSNIPMILMNHVYVECGDYETLTQLEEDGKSLDESKKSLSQETLPLMGQKKKPYLETSLDNATDTTDDDTPKKKFMDDEDDAPKKKFMDDEDDAPKKKYLETSLDGLDKATSEAGVFSTVFLIMESYVDAALYHNFRPIPSEELIKEAMKMLGEKLSPPYNVAVDVGCGSGQVTTLLAPYFTQVIGIDDNIGQIVKATKQNPGKNVSFRVGKADEIELESNSVDLVMVCEAIHWFDIPSFYSKVDTILKPNGLLVIAGYMYPEPILEPYSAKLFLLIKDWFAEHRNLWPEQHDLLINRYHDIPLLYSRTRRIDPIPSDKSATLAHVIGHIKSRSGVQILKEKDSKTATEIINKLQSSLLKIIEVDKDVAAEDVYLIKPPFNQAVDVGCGSGQATGVLAPFFDHVLGTDISESQINEATKKDTNTNVEFKTGSCYSIPLPDASTELVTAAQAAHWFNLPSFYKEVDRVLRPGGVVALYCYDYPKPHGQENSEKLRDYMNYVYNEGLCGFWHENKKLAEEMYKGIELPYEEQIRDKSGTWDTVWNLRESIGCVESWSGYHELKKQNAEKAKQLLQDFQDKIIKTLNVAPEEVKPPFKQAVDVGCGSGQSTSILASYFTHVLGTDISDSQIDEAIKRETNSNVQYKNGPCDSIPLPNSSADLVTTAQACHWFHLPSFYKEVDRVLRPGGVLAIYCYGFPKPYGQEKSLELKEHMAHLYNVDTAGYWHENRKIVDDMYKELELPYEEQIR
uniref:SRCR domain-containing protein n=1 Tax=Strigamia maritima TaxID=126957 RepID=T1J608_STRMM